MPDLIDLKLQPIIPTPEQTIQEQAGRLELGEKQRQLRESGQIRAILAKYGGDLEKAQPEIMAVSPELGLKFQTVTTEARKSALDFKRSQIEHAQREASFIGQSLGGAKNEEDWQGGLYALKQAGIATPPEFAHFDPGLADHLSAAAQTADQKAQRALVEYQRETQRLAQQETARKDAAAEAAKAKQPIKLGAGEQLVDPVTFQPVATGAAKTGTPGSFEDYTARYAKGKGKAVEDLTTADIEDARKRYQQADDRPRVNVSVSGGDASNVKEAIAGMKDGTIPPQMPGRASKDYTAIMAEAHRQGFDLAGAATDWAATQKHIASLNSNQQLRLNQAIGQLPELLDSVDALAAKWKAGRFPLLNKANLALAKGGAMGKEAASIANQLAAQIADVTGDLGAVYMGGNSPTDHALGLAAKSLSEDWDEKVLHDMTALARKNVQTRLHSIQHTGVAGASATNPYDRQNAPPPAAGPKNDPLGLFK